MDNTKEKHSAHTTLLTVIIIELKNHNPFARQFDLTLNKFQSIPTFSANVCRTDTLARMRILATSLPDKYRCRAQVSWFLWSSLGFLSFCFFSTFVPYHFLQMVRLSIVVWVIKYIFGLCKMIQTYIIWARCSTRCSQRCSVDLRKV